MMLNSKSYLKIAEHYQACFQQHGATPLGMDWPNPQDVQKRFQVMLELLPPKILTERSDCSLLDFGCGASHFYQFLMQKELTETIHYRGLDISPSVIDYCRMQFPQNMYQCVDVLEHPAVIEPVDYVVMNGVFTEKVALTFEEMLLFWQQMLLNVFPKCQQGLAFNVMSTHVDWQREDLFHLPLETMADFVVRHLSRHFVIRQDYGLYEYTVYVYQSPVTGSSNGLA